MSYNLNPFTRKLDDVGTGGAGAGVGAVSLSGNTAGAMALVSSGTMYLAGGNNITLSQNANSITISGAAAGGAQTGISALYDGANSISSGTVRLTNANGVSFTLNGNTLSGSVNTSYRASNDAVGLNTALTANGVSWTVNSSGLSLNVPAFLTTAMQSASSSVFAKTGFSSASTAGTDIVGTLNTNGLSIGVPKYITTAMASNASTQFVQANAAFAGTNASGTIASNGISVSVAAPGGGGALAASASNGSFTFSTLGFSNANNVTFGTSAGSIITASVAAPGAAAENNNINLLGANTAGNTTASGSTIGLSGVNLTLSGTNGSVVNISAPAVSSLSATGGLSISTNGSTISIGYAPLLSRFDSPEGIFTTLGQTGMGSLSLNHVYVPFNVTATAMKIGGSLSAATNTSATTASANVSLNIGIYTLNGSTLSLASSGSANNGFAWSQSASSTGNTSINSMRQMTVPININMTPGQYWIGALITQQTTYTSYGYTVYGNDRIASAGTNAVLTPIGSGTTANRDVMLYQGIYTAATASLPSAIQGANINQTSASNVQRANFYWAAYNATY